MGVISPQCCTGQGLDDPLMRLEISSATRSLWCAIARNTQARRLVDPAGAPPARCGQRV